MIKRFIMVAGLVYMQISEMYANTYSLPTYLLTSSHL